MFTLHFLENLFDSVMESILLLVGSWAPQLIAISGSKRLLEKVLYFLEFFSFLFNNLAFIVW